MVRLKIVHRNVEALVDLSSTVTAIEILGKTAVAFLAVALLGFHARRALSQDLNRPSR